MSLKFIFLFVILNLFSLACTSEDSIDLSSKPASATSEDGTIEGGAGTIVSAPTVTPPIPSFQMGWVVDVTRPELLEIGKNLGGSLAIVRPDQSEELIFDSLDQAASLELDVWLLIPDYYYSLDLIAGKSVEPKMEGLRNFIKSYKDHSAVTGWYLEAKGLDDTQVGILNNVYSVIKSIDGKRISIASDGLESVDTLAGKLNAQYANNLDNLIHEYNPVKVDPIEFSSTDFPNYPLSMEAGSQFAQDNEKGFYNSIQSDIASDSGLEPEGIRNPTVNELSYMLYSAVTNLANGVLFQQLSSDETWLRQVSAPVLSRFNEILPIISSIPEAPTLVNTLPPTVKIKEIYNVESRRYYYIIVNPGSEAVTIDLQTKLDNSVYAALHDVDLAIFPNQPQSLDNIALGSFDIVTAQRPFQVSLNPFSVKVLRSVFR